MTCSRTGVVLSLALLLTGCGGAVHAGKPVAVRVAPTDPYRASQRYVRCMREHGIDLPAPRANGDIELSPADEKRIGRVGAKNFAADRACFRFLRGTVDTTPISARGRARMAKIMRKLSACMRAQGYDLGSPTVSNIGRGRIALLFPHASAATMAKAGTPAYERVKRRCERGVPAQLDRIVREERGSVSPY